MTSGSLQKYHRDEVNDDKNENDNVGNYKINIKKATTSNSSEYKTKRMGNTPAIINILIYYTEKLLVN